MKYTLTFCLCLCTFHDIVVSNILVKKITTGISQAKEDIKCVSHRITNLITLNRDTACEGDGNAQQNAADEENYKSAVEIYNVTVNDNIQTSTEEMQVTVPDNGGKRLIIAAKNCPEGQRDDGHGNCRLTGY